MDVHTCLQAGRGRGAPRSTVWSMDSTLRGPGDLIAFLPYELGFIPTDSLVVVGLVDGGIDVVARLDLGPEGGMAPGVAWIGAALRRADVRDAIVCLFLTTAAALERAGSPHAVLDRARDHLSSHRVDVEHLLLITENLWWAHLCGCGHCPTCPTDVPEPDRVGAVFQSVLRGVAPLATRDRLGESLQCTRPDLAREVETAALVFGPASRHRLRRVLLRILVGNAAIGEISAVDLAAVGNALTDPLVRDEVFGWVSPNAPQPDVPDPDAAVDAHQRPLVPVRNNADPLERYDGPALRARLIQWLQCLPDRFRPPVLTLIAGSAWSDGSGALAAVAVEEALRLDPRYRLAQLLGRAVERGIRPRRCA